MSLFLFLLAAFALLHLPVLRNWPGGPLPADKAAGALGLVMPIPGVMHFAAPDRFVAMVPPFLPSPEGLVHVSGTAELLLAAALLIPETRRAAGWFGVALFLAMWPANIHVAVSGDYPAELSQSPLYHVLRVPFQLLYVGWAAWVALGHLPGLDFRRRMMARYYDRVNARHEEWTQPLRADLLRDVRGTVLELGPGTGANFAHFPNSDIHWIGVEPNAHMHTALRARAAEHGISAAAFRTVTAEGMDVPADSVDVVLSTLVLCTVGDLTAVLADIRRVLRPGGRFLFLEHVAAPRGTSVRRLQRVLRPLWNFIADGCCPDREIATAIRDAGFSDIDLRELDVPRDVVPPFVAPHIVGTAAVRGPVST